MNGVLARLYSGKSSFDICANLSTKAVLADPINRSLHSSQKSLARNRIGRPFLT
jgi:hypothetical protein